MLATQKHIPLLVALALWRLQPCMISRLHTAVAKTPYLVLCTCGPTFQSCTQLFTLAAYVFSSCFTILKSCLRQEQWLIPCNNNNNVVGIMSMCLCMCAARLLPNIMLKVSSICSVAGGSGVLVLAVGGRRSHSHRPRCGYSNH
jgi:hypothetical protein